MVLSMLNLGIISHERTKSRFVADYSLVTTQHPQGMSSYLTVVRQQV